ncbi:S-methyl-5-thioadenosine phosphorylase [Coemansia erecta]|nr:S-methyl-5-thioadenosine phosphorylase [Coemansia erecta]
MVAGHPFHVAFDGIATHLGGRSSSGNDDDAPADGEPNPMANRVAEPDNADSTLADEITKYVYSKRTIYNNNAGIEENIDAGYTYSELDNYRARTKSGNGLTVLSEDAVINEYLGAPRRSAPDAALAVSATSDNLDLWPPVWDQDVRIGVIGGTGLYSLDGLNVIETLAVETPWGQPSGPITIAETERGHKIAFLARHGPSHSVLPSEVNYRANIAALKALGVQAILAFSAVGSLREEISPGDFVLIDQIIDRTKGVRADSFFTGTGVTAHATFGEPVSAGLRALVARHAAAVPDIAVHTSGTGVCMEGPAFSTRAESNLYRAWGASVINMTCIPESKLAREAEITYAIVCMATDYDAWRESEEPVTVAEVMHTMKGNAANAKTLLLALLPDFEDAVYNDSAKALMRPEAGSMQYAFQQPPEKQSAAGRATLNFLFPQYFTV